MTEFEIIPADALRDVTGGGGWTRRFQKLYKWWTHTKKPTSRITPKEIYNEGKRIVRDIGIGAGAIYGYKKGLDRLDARHDAPTPTSHASASPVDE